MYQVAQEVTKVRFGVRTSTTNPKGVGAESVHEKSGHVSSYIHQMRCDALHVESERPVADDMRHPVMKHSSASRTSTPPCVQAWSARAA